MKRKFVLGILTVVCAFSLIACGANKTDNSEEHSKTPETQKQTDTENESEPSENEGGNDVKLEFSEEERLMGYSFYYPKTAQIGYSELGRGFQLDKIGVFIEAPSNSGIEVKAENLEASPEICEKYIFETLEGRVRSLFNHGATEQEIKNTTKVEKNGIEMLRIDGVFRNTKKNTEVDFVCYFLMTGTNGDNPLYVLGIEMEDGANVAEFVDEMAGYIKK